MALCFISIAVFFGITETKELLIAVPFIVMCVLFLSMSVSVFIKIIKRPKERIIRNSVLMKLSVFFLCAALSFWGFPDGVYAFSVFLAFGGILTAAAIFYIRVKFDVNLFPKANQYRNDYSYCYDAEWEWEAAAKEAEIAAAEAKLAVADAKVATATAERDAAVAARTSAESERDAAKAALQRAESERATAESQLDAVKYTPSKVKIRKVNSTGKKAKVSWKTLKKNTKGYEICVISMKTGEKVKTVKVKQSKKKPVGIPTGPSGGA